MYLSIPFQCGFHLKTCVTVAFVIQISTKLCPSSVSSPSKSSWLKTMRKTPACLGLTLALRAPIVLSHRSCTPQSGISAELMYVLHPSLMIPTDALQAARSNTAFVLLFSDTIAPCWLHGACQTYNNQGNDIRPLNCYVNMTALCVCLSSQ